VILGYRPDVPDIRDIPFAELSPKLRLASPGTDPFLLPLLRNPKRQAGDSCVGNAWTRAREILGDATGVAVPELSGQFAYWGSRQRHGEQGKNEGTYLRTCAAAATKTGICEEATWPTDLGTILDQPPPAAFVEAHDYRLDVYTRIRSSGGQDMLDEIEQSVRSLHPVVFGVLVGPEFVRYDGSLQVFGPPERILGGHALVAVGVEGVGDDRIWTWLSSWGEWGISGKGLVRCTSEYMRQASDAWVGTAAV
jgi:hypothetical protein